MIPYSAIKTEYEREFGQVELSPRAILRRRSTSLKLEESMEYNLPVATSEKQSEFHAYTEDETLKYPYF